MNTATLNREQGLDLSSTNGASRSTVKIAGGVLVAAATVYWSAWWFMPVAGEQGFGIEFCPDAAALPPGIAAASAGHAHHHHAHTGGAGHGDDPGSALHHAPCLFAASATLATAPVHAAPLAAPPGGDGLGERFPTGQLFPPTILRAQSPSGPPPWA